MPDNIYLDPAIARDELESRRAQRLQIEAWWEALGVPQPPPEIMAVERPAVLARHVATARYEDLVFNALARRVGLTPVWPELVGDGFACQSPFKRQLVHRRLCAGRGRRGGLKISRENFLDILPADRVPLANIARSDGKTLVAYHHELQEIFLPGARRCDFSAMMYAAGKRAQDYYPVAMSIYIAHAVLFEDYHGGESGEKLDGFTSRVFEPAREFLIQKFGLAPLIVRMPWQDEFAFYPAGVETPHAEVIGEGLL